MPYNSETGQYERRVTTILDETPDGDTVNSAVAVKIDAAVDDGPTDLNHHKVQGGHYPATSTATGSRYLHQSPAGVVSWRDGVPADQAAQADASNVTDGAAWRAAIGAEAAGAGVAAATAAVATHNTDASAHGLDSTVWPVAQGGTGASTAEDARAALDVYSKGAVDAALGGIRTGTAHAPQSIIKAALGPRPDGWTAVDCDAPVASLSYNGNVVTVEEGLQVAYADTGRVQLSEELTSPQTVDLSAAADGTPHVYADIAEDGTFSGFGHTDIPPETGTSRGGVDVIPAFSGYTLAGWGTVSADSENDPLYAAWKAFNRTAADTDDFWASGRNDGTGWLRMVFTAPRTVVGYILVPRSGGTNTYMPESWAFKYGGTDTPDTTAQVVSGFVFPGQGIAGKSVFMLDAPVTAASIEIEVTASADPNNLVGLAMFVPLFAGDLYNPTTLTAYDKDNNPIRRVYIGTVVKSSGAITSVQGFALGDRVRLPATGTILDNPFGGWRVQATQGTALLSATPAAISGVTVNTTPVVVRR